MLLLLWSSLQALSPMTACHMEGSQREEEDPCGQWMRVGGSGKATLKNYSSRYLKIASYQPRQCPQPAHFPSQREPQDSAGAWHVPWAAGPVAIFMEGLCHVGGLAYLSR